METVISSPSMLGLPFDTLHDILTVHFQELTGEVSSQNLNVHAAAATRLQEPPTCLQTIQHYCRT